MSAPVKQTTPREAKQTTGDSAKTHVYTHVFLSGTSQLVNSVSSHVIKLIRLITARRPGYSSLRNRGCRLPRSLRKLARNPVLKFP